MNREEYVEKLEEVLFWGFKLDEEAEEIDDFIDEVGNINEHIQIALDILKRNM